MRDAPPIFFLRHQKENAPRPVEKKKCFGGSVRMDADLLPPAGDGWHSLAAVRDGNTRPLGNPLARGGTGIHSASLSAAAYASAKDQAARSEAERAEREAGQMRSCTPTNRRTIRHGTAVSIWQKILACPKASPNRSRHRYADPRQRGGAQAPERVPAPFSFGPCTARFLFGQDRKENGGCIPAWDHAPWREPSPGAVEKKHPPCGGHSFVGSGAGHTSPPT